MTQHKSLLVSIKVTLFCLLLLSFNVSAMSYSYDPLGRLTSVVYDNGDAISYRYDRAGNMTKTVVALANVDSDGDGVDDVDDAFPDDSTETLDTDGDNIGNNTDLDDDGDGISDLDELASGTDPLVPDVDQPGSVDIVASNIVSGHVIFKNDSGNEISVPADAWVGILPSRFANDESNWNRLTCPIDTNGNFGQDCHVQFDEAGIRQAFSDTAEKFQVTVFKNHIESQESHWNCGEDLYRFVGGSETFESWASIVVAAQDYQDRSNEQCSSDSSGSGVDLSEHLVAHFEFENDANDSSGNANHGLEFGDVSYVDGVVGQAIKLNGVNSAGGTLSPDHIQVSNSSSLQFDKAMSLAYWVKIDGNQAQTSANCSGDSIDGIRGISVAKRGDRAGFYINDGEFSTSFGINPYAGGKGLGIGDVDNAYQEFRHVAYVVDDQTISIYVNGTLVASDDGIVDFTTANLQDLYIGVSQNEGGACFKFWYPLDGVLDDVRIYSRLLNEVEIAELASTNQAKDFDGDGVVDALDRDDDNDGVLDVNDYFPFDASESLDFDRDGTGDNADLDDDNDQMPDEFELANGLDPLDSSDAGLDKDGDGESNVVEFQQGSDINHDSVPPVVTAPDDLQVDATGLYTPVVLGTAYANDMVDGDVSATSSADASFRPGRHEVVWSASDSEGNTATDVQTVVVLPLANFELPQIAPEGGEVVVRVHLNGDAAEYPVTIPYTLSGVTQNPEDHDGVNGALVISEGREAQFSIQLVDDGPNEGDEALIVTMGQPSNAALGETAEHVVTIVEGNVAPRVNLTLSQNTVQTRIVTLTGGDLVVSALVDDANPQDSHQFDWSLTDNLLLPPGDVDSSSFLIDSSSLTPGLYRIYVTVVDNGAGNLTTEKEYLFRVIEQAQIPVLTEVDSDGDGQNDDVEGFGDSDGDGIPNYLDAIEQSSVIQTQRGNNETYLVQTNDGLHLKLGEFAFESGKNAALVTVEEIGIQSKEGFDYLYGLIDFVIEGLSHMGGSVDVLIPLESPIPANAVYRKYSSNSGWQDFVVDESNQIASAIGSPGICPELSSDEYDSGLQKGSHCVQLTIEDGGPNDADGKANGVVVDPSGLAVPSPVENETSLPEVSSNSSDGGGGSFSWGVTLLLILFYLMSRHRFLVKRSGCI